MKNNRHLAIAMQQAIATLGDNIAFTAATDEQRDNLLASSTTIALIHRECNTTTSSLESDLKHAQSISASYARKVRELNSEIERLEREVEILNSFEDIKPYNLGDIDSHTNITLGQAFRAMDIKANKPKKREPSTHSPMGRILREEVLIDINNILFNVFDKKDARQLFKTAEDKASTTSEMDMYKWLDFVCKSYNSVK